MTTTCPDPHGFAWIGTVDVGELEVADAEVDPGWTTGCEPEGPLEHADTNIKHPWAATIRVVKFMATIKKDRVEV